jgi:PAS domain S-box-containing protein
MLKEASSILQTPSRSLRFRITAMLLVCATSLLLVSMTFNYLIQKQKLIDELNRTASKVVNRLAFTMAQPLWNFDQKHLEALELQELKDPAVLSVLVLATDKGLLSVGRKKTHTDPEGIQNFSEHENEAAGTLHRQLPILYNNQSIGSVHVVLTDLVIQQELASLLVQQTLQALFILTGITVLAYLGLSRILLSPLRELHQTAKSYGKGDLAARTLVRSNDEIGMLSSTMNKMAEQIAEKITTIQQTEQLLRESNAFRTRVFESSPIAITVMDVESFKFIDCNPEAVRLYGFTSAKELLERGPLSVSAPFQYDGTSSEENIVSLVKRVQKEISFVFEWRHQRPNGEQWDADVHLIKFMSDSRELVQFTVQDITERKRVANLMVQTEKMMMVGGLAAGMAHEINNPLGIITQTVQNIQRRLAPDLPANQIVADQLNLDLATLQQYLEVRQIFSFIKSIREATDRAARIISNMLKFSRKSESFSEFADISELIDQVLELAASDYDLKKNYDFKRVSIVRDIPADLPKVPVSVLEVEQVLLNLLKNAAQAMYEATTQYPQITLRAQCENSFVMIDVEDNGPGMPLEVQKRIFEPFYTTKEVGKGTGLGLSVSYSIITTNHNGRLEVHSQPGRGTCFTIRLPLQRSTGKTKGVSE